MTILSNRLNQADLNQGINMNTVFAEKSDTLTHEWTKQPETLIATYVDAENKFWYTISEDASHEKHIHKMSITRDIQHARAVNIKAKKMIGKKVHFGVTKGWSPLIWFNDIKEEGDVDLTGDF